MHLNGAGVEKHETRNGHLRNRSVLGGITRKTPKNTGKDQSTSKQANRLLTLLSRSPPPAAQGLLASLGRALRSRLGAGGARRLTPSHIAQHNVKNQKPFSGAKTGHGGRGAPLVT